MDHLQEVLDLSIVFTKPPPGSSSEILAQVAFQCETLGLSHTGEVFADPLTQRERDDLSWYLEEYWKWPYLEFATRGERVEALLGEVGRRLYQALFHGREAQNIVQAWQQQGSVRHQISIVSEIASVLRLPWELLADPQGFLVPRVDHPISIVRLLPTKGEQATLTTPFQLPLRILLVTARPEDAGFVDPRSISRELVDALQRQSEAGIIELEFLRPPTFTALSARLKNTERPIHVLHFDGHGGLDRKAQQGMLLFETEVGKPSPVKASDLAKILKNSGVRLAVLTACQSAMSTGDDAFSSVSTQLLNNGVDAVIAMSSSILVTSAVLYVEAFYHALSEGLPVSIAHEQARQALQKDSRRHPFRRRQDEEAVPVILADWWVPHFYQQRPLTLHATTAPHTQTPPQPQATAPVRFNKTMPPEPRYRFNGRARELLQIERALLRQRLVVISGFGGMGKTALAREAADWLTRTEMYQRVCFVSFEGGRNSAASLLSQLGLFLEVYDGTYTPDNLKAALAQLSPALKARRTLVIADNLESIVPGGEAPLDTEARTQLWDVLLELQQLEAGVLLTSRTTAFGDGRLAEGARVVHLSLSGLLPDDAYSLASSLLSSLHIDRSHAPYALLREVLGQVDYHPLAIQMVLPALRSHSLLQIKQDFAVLLPNFTDDTETGRNRSLVASLEYSIRQLSAAQQAWLPRLSVFEGGAMENDLLAITEIAEADWARLRLALEQAALLTVEHLEGMRFPFLHFHPVLIPSLRGQHADEALERRYAERYRIVAHYYHNEHDLHPLEIRGIVQRELPNLRRAFLVLLEAGHLEEAVVMADCVGRFLTFFGLHREWAQIQQRLAQVLAAQQQQDGDLLTSAEFTHESNLGEQELQTGRFQAALSRFQRLLARIEVQSEGRPRGPGSYEHAITLHQLGHCLFAEGNYAAAEHEYRQGSVLIEVLVQHDPKNRYSLQAQAGLLADLGNALLMQGHYAQAKAAHEQALQIYERVGDQRDQAVSRGQLGMIALEQGAYMEARARYQQALATFHTLGEPEVEAGIWHQLGSVAQREQHWQEAERCFRESISLTEQLGDLVGVARTCNHLGQVAHSTGRVEEAKGWYRRALALSQQANTSSAAYASHLCNLAALLVEEVQVGHVQEAFAQLEEARRYTEQALSLHQALRTNHWADFFLLATIADLQGHREAARAYRHQEQSAYASFAGNRFQIDRQWGSLFPALAQACDDQQARAQMEERLTQLETKGWHLTPAMQRIWAGERDWQSLVEGLKNQHALIILRVLETIAGPESILASLPTPILEAIQQGDRAALVQALVALAPAEQQRVLTAIHTLRGQAEDGESEQGK